LRAWETNGSPTNLIPDRGRRLSDRGLIATRFFARAKQRRAESGGLATFSNVLITSHQAFFTQTALEEIACVTMKNLTVFERGEATGNEVGAKKYSASEGLAMTHCLVT
jgi:hypothetical protein